MGTAREGHTATLLNDGKVLVAGGASLVIFNCGNNCTAHVPISVPNAELFDPATKTFTGTDALGTARFLQTGTLLNDGSVLVTGGNNCEVNLGLQVCNVLSSTELF